jgi:hypothetical protein
MNVLKRTIVIFSILALALLPAGPVYAASEQGMAHGQGKGLNKSEVAPAPQIQQETVNTQTTTHKTSSPSQTQHSKTAKTTGSSKQTTTATQTQAPKGNNGTLKIHEKGTPSGTENNDPKVCSFNVEGFGFDADQTGYLQFTVQGDDKPTGTDAGPYSFGPTSANGFYASQYFTLTDGHYKATLYGKMLPGGQLTDFKAKSKVFKVRCSEVISTTTCPAGSTWNDKNGNKKVDAGECATGSNTPKTPDEEGEVLSANTTANDQLVNTGANTLAASLVALVALITAVGLGLATKRPFRT